MSAPQNPANPTNLVIDFPENLPVSGKRDEIMAALEKAGVSPFVALCCAIAAAPGPAPLIHTLIEQPALSLIRGWWRGRKQLLPAAMVWLARTASKMVRHFRWSWCCPT